MSIDQRAINSFFREIGRSRKPGIIRIVGGGALVMQGIRPEGVTEDLDLQVVGDLDNAIRQAQRKLNIHVEFVEPSAFIPLPSGWENRCPFIGRQGNVDVFCFDFITIALTKILRANQRDVQDIILLAKSGYINKQHLAIAVQQTAKQLGKGNYKKLSPQKFIAHYQNIENFL